MAAISVTLPDLGESVTEGTITRWLKAEGDLVEKDEPLLEVATDKVDTEVPSPATGRLTALTAAEDDVITVGSEIAVIDDDVAAEATPSGDPVGTPGSSADSSPRETSGDAVHQTGADIDSRSEPVSTPTTTSDDDAEASEATQVMPLPAAADTPRYLTPLVRRMAAELDVDFSFSLAAFPGPARVGTERFDAEGDGCQRPTVTDSPVDDDSRPTVRGGSIGHVVADHRSM